MECKKISPISQFDTTNPTKSVKVNSVTSPKLCNTTSTSTKRPPLESHRGNWLIGLRTMWSRVKTTLKVRRRNFTKLTCMRRRRERSEKVLTFLHLSLLHEQSKIRLNELTRPECTRRISPVGLFMESHLEGKLTGEVNA